jgi:hypothetical protein
VKQLSSENDGAWGSISYKFSRKTGGETISRKEIREEGDEGGMMRYD